MASLAGGCGYLPRVLPHHRLRESTAEWHQRTFDEAVEGACNTAAEEREREDDLAAALVREEAPEPDRRAVAAGAILVALSSAQAFAEALFPIVPDLILRLALGFLAGLVAGFFTAVLSVSNWKTLEEPRSIEWGSLLGTLLLGVGLFLVRTRLYHDGLVALGWTVFDLAVVLALHAYGARCQHLYARWAPRKDREFTADSLLKAVQQDLPRWRARQDSHRAALEAHREFLEREHEQARVAERVEQGEATVLDAEETLRRVRAGQRVGIRTRAARRRSL